MQQSETAAPTSTAQLTYYGGPVLSSVKVHAVYWSAKVKYQTELDGFYKAITQSAYFDWLDEYDTPKQHIGRGQLAGAFVDTQTGTEVTHEQIEAVTDPAVGLATSFGPPLAWYDVNNGEIGDICVGQGDTIAGYTVQREWSNAAGACIASKSSGGCSCQGKSCGDDSCGHS